MLHHLAGATIQVVTLILYNCHPHENALTNYIYTWFYDNVYHGDKIHDKDILMFLFTFRYS